jgi:hypothetical protein
MNSFLRFTDLPSIESKMRKPAAYVEKQSARDLTCRPNVCPVAYLMIRSSVERAHQLVELLGAANADIIADFEDR